MASIAPPIVPSLLTTRQYKLDKGQAQNWATFGIQLSPANEAGVGNMCAYADSCALGCIAVTGRNGMPSAMSARVRRTVLYRKFPKLFHAQLDAEITLWKLRMRAHGFALAARPNTTSDQPLLGQHVARMNPDVQVYDYTKLPHAARRRMPNYHLTYSYSERTTAADIAECIAERVNVAVIFDTKRGDALPSQVTLHGHTFDVLDGDANDLRFLDPSDRSYVVGLRWKTSADNASKLAHAVRAGLAISVTDTRVAA